jgi:hypothetical protein
MSSKISVVQITYFVRDEFGKLYIFKATKVTSFAAK